MESPGLLELMRAQTEGAVRDGYTRFYNGFDRGLDLTYAAIVLMLRANHPDIRLVSVLAHEEQAARWSFSDHDLCYALLEQCDEEVMLQARYSHGCYLRRDRYMAERSSLVLSVYAAQPSDIMRSLNYARETGARVLCVDPIKLAAYEL